jgi:hypothetical protein
MTVTVSGWTRTPPGAGAPATEATTATLRIEAGGYLMARSDLLLNQTNGLQTNDWRPISATAHIEAGMQQVVLRISADNQQAEFDDFGLKDDVGPVPWYDPIFRPVLINPSAESGSWGLRPALESSLPSGLVALAETLPNPQPFDMTALWGSYAGDQYKSFWGNFGWLSIPLPDPLYALLVMVLIIAMVGLTVRVVRRWGRWDWVDLLGLVCGVALIATVAGTYAWQTMGLATRSLTADLAGRYLFVLIVPIVWLLLAGLRSVWPLVSGAGTENAEAEARLPWGAWLYITLLAMFAAYCLMTLILPYYYA